MKMDCLGLYVCGKKKLPYLTHSGVLDLCVIICEDAQKSSNSMDESPLQVANLVLSVDFQKDGNNPEHMSKKAKNLKSIDLFCHFVRA